jgi:hypothetical protein
MTSHWNERSAVQSVTFERATHTLRVEFESGAMYDFADVPERVYDEMAHSPEPDTYFRDHIRDEFIPTRVGEVDLAEMAHERREDALLGPPLAEPLPDEVGDDRVDDRAVPLGTGGSSETPERPRHHVTRHTWVVDVIDEDSAAVQVDGRQITPLPRWLLPADAHEGDILRVAHARSAGRSTIAIEVDRGATRLAFERSADQIRAAPTSDIGHIDLRQ